MRGQGIHVEPQAVQSSVWAIRLALFCLALVILTIVFHRIFGMSTLVALNLFTLAFVGCGLVLVISLFALIRIWQRGWRGGSNAVTGMLIALAILSWPASFLPTLRSTPMINDVTTDFKNPPQFYFVGEQRPKGANPIAYPGEAFAKLQAQSYADLRAIAVDRPAEETLELARQALRRLRMSVIGETPVGAKGAGWGQLEAVDRTLVLGFYDDVAVRVIATRRGSLVDVRSASRFGKSDLGRNAQRIRVVQAEIIARVEATVPAARTRRRGGRRSSLSDEGGRRARLQRSGTRR